MIESIDVDHRSNLNKMENQQTVVIQEISSVVEEIGRLKLLIQNMNNRTISKSDKLGILAFLSDKKSKLMKSHNLISGIALERWENEGGNEV